MVAQQLRRLQEAREEQTQWTTSEEVRKGVSCCLCTYILS